MARQRLTLQLAGITAGDYLQWVRDPDPPALDAGLLAVTVAGAPLGDTVTATLEWAGAAPSAIRAAPLAGLPLGAGARIVGCGEARAMARTGERSRDCRAAPRAGDSRRLPA
ncbi:MAG: hypothetical protein QOE75_1218 [Solirubrobacterales bacterium]|jgi:hypothetical protein|nr:hypothetical protein [Solirubrobacterales bacterium]